MQDIALSHRFLVSHPGFTLAAVLTLALGVGANISIFGVFHAVLIRPLPLSQPERLVAVSEANVIRGISYDSCSQRIVTALRERRDVFSGITAFYRRIANLGGIDEPATITSWQTDAEFFDTLGLKLAMGRGFSREEARPGAPGPVAVLSSGLWQRRFGADPKVIGRVIRVDDIEVTVIGVMPPVENWLAPDLLVPLQPIVTDFQSRRMLGVIGRLQTGMSLDRTAALLQATSEAVGAEWPETHAGWTVKVHPLMDGIVGTDTRRLLYLMGAAVFVVLLIACANLANLLLARAFGRCRELAIHTALGAGRLQLARRLMTESIMLAILGGVVGLLLSLWGIDVIRTFGAEQIPRVDAAGLGWPVLAFAAGETFLVGLLTGLIPAVQIARIDARDVLREANGSCSMGAPRQKMSSLLVIGEIALALGLLSSASLLGRSILRASSVNPGLEVEDRVAVTVNLPPSRYRDGNSVIDFWSRLLERLGTVPGVRSAAATSDRWLLAGRRVVEYDVEGDDGMKRRVPVAELRTVTPGYFHTLGIPVLKGRVFDDGDRGPVDAPPEMHSMFVVVVSKTLAARQWPGEQAIGKRIRPIVGNQMSYWSTVIGIVDDIRQSALTESPVPTVYLPEYQYAWRRLFLLVHTADSQASVLPGIKEAIAEVDATLPFDDVVPLTEIKHESLLLERSVTWILILFSGIAVALSAIGVYGLIAYSVTRRTQEFGIRIALGAQRKDILRLVLRQGIGLALAGEALGITLALALSASLRSMLFEIAPTDPVTHAGVAGFLLITAACACLVPAFRATRVDPAKSLRAE